MTLKGYACKYLYTDLTSKKITEKKLSEKTAKQFIGGYGIIARTLMDIPKGTDPLSD